MARLIGTAGHVDHGKTSLIRALTGIDADRLPEEQARGMTIDVGFAYLDLPNSGRVSIVDVPGHERFIRNMLVGALGTDVALLCVAADEGVKPQTREHFLILSLLPVAHLVVALTRADLADADMRELATLEVQDLLEGSRFADAPILPVSSVSGEGLSELKDALDALLTESEPAREGPWYLPIDRAFSLKGHGVVVTGTLAQGEVNSGTTAWLEPSHQEVRIRSIHSHGEPLARATAGQRTALNLGGTTLEDLERGMAIGSTGALFASNCVDLAVEWVDGVEIKHGQRVRLSVGAEEVLGKLFLNDAQPNLTQVRLESPVAVALRQPAILRRHSPMDVLGGGRVVVPLAVPRRRSEVAVQITAQRPDEAVVEILNKSPEGVITEEVCRALGQSKVSLGPVFEALQDTGSALGFAGLWFSKEAFAETSARFLAALASLHEASPRVSAHARELVASRAGLRWAGKPLDRIMAHLASQGQLEVHGTAVRLVGFQIDLSEKQRAFLDRVQEALESAGVNVPSASELSVQLHVPPQAVTEILRLGIEAGVLVRLDDSIIYTRRQLEGFKDAVRALPSPFAAAQVRDALGTSRKYVIPLLEHFDSVGFTLRQGDNRVVRSR